MAFTVREFYDLVEILENEPAWRVELRRLLLTEDILGLPQAVRDLTRSVQELLAERRQNEARFAWMEGDLTELGFRTLVAGEHILDDARQLRE